MQVRRAAQVDKHVRLVASRTLTKLWMQSGSSRRPVLTVSTDYWVGEDKRSGDLTAGSPIGWRIRDAPEARSGLSELHCNFSRPHQILLNVDHATLSLFPAGDILHEEPLLRRYQARQGYKRTVRADIERLSPFGELWALIWRSMDNN